MTTYNDASDPVLIYTIIFSTCAIVHGKIKCVYENWITGDSVQTTSDPVLIYTFIFSSGQL